MRQGRLIGLKEGLSVVGDGNETNEEQDFMEKKKNNNQLPGLWWWQSVVTGTTLLSASPPKGQCLHIFASSRMM